VLEAPSQHHGVGHATVQFASMGTKTKPQVRQTHPRASSRTHGPTLDAKLAMYAQPQATVTRQTPGSHSPPPPSPHVGRQQPAAKLSSPTVHEMPESQRKLLKDITAKRVEAFHVAVAHDVRH